VIAPEERVAQMVIAPVLLPEIVESDALSGTERGAGGFGSTGKS
ncbi:MAG: dUTP diphosphatase, partial [Ruminococcus sp.]|nr:dUTP diphosphatase [Ruminococcus sp.]